MNREKREFFASQNTCDGFRNEFPTIFSEEELCALYVIKGGPGTGKSHLMKQLASAWERAGDPTERFLCSSDPDSLDGVLNLRRRIAVIDGTAPHRVDPKYPGCVGRILYTGSFWDPKRLEAKRETIRSLTEKKQKLFSAAYAYLKAAGQLEKGRRILATQNLNKEKLLSAAERFLAKELAGKGNGSRELRLTAGFNKNGLTRLHSFEAMARRRVLVCDVCTTGHLFLEALLEKSTLPVLCSYSPLCPDTLDGLYFPEKELAVVCDKKEDFEALYVQADRYVNMGRFLDAIALRENRGKLRFAAKCRDALLKGATEAFAKAAEEHRHLEEIYMEAMDFSAFSAFENRLIRELS